MYINKISYIFLLALFCFTEVYASNVIDKKITVSQKKQNFKNILVPIVVEVYKKLEKKYLLVQSDIENNINEQLIEKLKKEYNVNSDKDLLIAIKPHPISIVLAQAAIESGWLTSRFSKEANNIFGVWSFNKNEPRIAASGLRGNKTIYLKKYKTINDAVLGYYKNLGTHRAYKEFRKQRALTNDPYKLSNYLINYSEKKEEYSKLLKSVIKYNKFYNYDIQSSIPLETKILKKIKSDNI